MVRPSFAFHALVVDKARRVAKRVAPALTRGRTIQPIATEAGLTRNTVRSRVKAVLAKTGTSRQAEAAALLAGLPQLRSRNVTQDRIGGGQCGRQRR